MRIVAISTRIVVMSPMKSNFWDPKNGGVFIGKGIRLYWFQSNVGVVVDVLFLTSTVNSFGHFGTLS